MWLSFAVSIISLRLHIRGVSFAVDDFGMGHVVGGVFGVVAEVATEAAFVVVIQEVDARTDGDVTVWVDLVLGGCHIY